MNRWFLSSIVNKNFDKSRLLGKRIKDLSLFTAKTKRAGLALAIVVSVPFFPWTSVRGEWVMNVYAVAVNVPMQRYNRGEVEKYHVLEVKESRWCHALMA